MPDDYRQDTLTAGLVAVGGSVTGEIETGGDHDWFAVTLEAGKTYRIDLEGSRTNAGTLRDPYLRGIYDADGNFINGTTNDDGGYSLNSRVVFTATADATYYVAAGAYGSREGTYTLSVTDVTVDTTDDYPAGTGTTGTIEVGGSVASEIEIRGDRDWFAVILEAGKTYRIDLEGSETGAGTLRDPFLRGLYDANGDLIWGTVNDDGGTGRNSRVVYTATADETYYVSAGGFGRSVGTYRLSVADITDSVVDDYPAGTGTTGTVEVGGSVTGEVERWGDRDWFAMTLETGKTYQIDLEGSWTDAGTLGNPYLYGIYDANGDFIEDTANDNGGTDRNSRTFFTATDNATYYVAAGALGDREGTYTLSVTEIQDDYPAGTRTTGTVEVGGSVTGEIEKWGDHDWFAMTLEEGTTYRIDLEGVFTDAGTLSDPFLHGIYDAEGDLIYGTTDDDGGTGYNSRVVFTATESATYYVAAGGARTSAGTSVGTYTLSVTQVADDYAAGTGTTGTVDIGASVTGTIETANDRDWFAVTLERGKSYQIDLEGSETGAGTLRDPYLRGLYDVNGEFIAGTTNDDGGTGSNSRVVYTATADATYYVAAGSLRNTLGTYTLSVTDVTDNVPDDDYPAGTGTTGRVEVGDSVTGEIERDADQDWFAMTLEAGKTYQVDLEGSPTGAGNLSDPYLRGVYDVNGEFIAGTTNDDGGTGRNSRVVFTATADATYYVAAGAYGSREGTYRLSVTDVTDNVTDDHPAGTGTTGTVEVGGSVTGEIEREADRDWFAVTLEAGTTYRIDLEGSRTNAGTLRDPYLRGIYDADGNFINGTTNDDGGYSLNSRVVFTATADATYYVAAGAYGSREGTYTLSVDEL